MSELKIIFAGPMGAGKTTAIEAISDIAPVRTEAANSDWAQSSKLTTTVALDYGEVLLDNGEKLKLFGTPGQARFDFMWRHVAQGALGLVILLDCSRPAPLEDLMQCLDAFPEFVQSSSYVIGLGRQDENTSINWSAKIAALEGNLLRGPALTVDVRKRKDVLLLIDVLLHVLESNGRLH